MPDHFRQDEAEFGVGQILTDAVAGPQSKRLESAFVIAREFGACDGKPAFREEVVGAVEVCFAAVGGDYVVAYYCLLLKSV